MQVTEMAHRKGEGELSLQILSEINSIIKDVNKNVAVLLKKKQNGDLNTSKVYSIYIYIYIL